jgi:hypothetical protein
MIPQLQGGLRPEEREMASQGQDEGNSNETKYMWIAVAVIAVIILGGMGINMLVHHETSGEAIEMSSQKSGPQQ